jgi:hypothetical protein
VTRLESREIEMFKNLSQFEAGQICHDFHNDFDCIKLLFESTFLILLFRNIKYDSFVSFKFEKAILERVEFLNFEDLKKLTVDNIYRGRSQRGNELIEFDFDGRAYFYIDFYEGPKIELWCKNISIDGMETCTPAVSM